jgi:heavy metal sensor kinase
LALRWFPHTLRGRLIAWYTVLLIATLLALGGTTAVLLDRSLRANVDSSLESLAQTIAEAARRPSAFGSGLDELLESMLGPEVAQRFFRLLDPRGLPDPRLAQRGQAQLPLSETALRNAAAGRETYETLTLPGRGKAPLRLLTVPVVEHGRVVDVVQVAASLEPVEVARSHFLLILLGLAPIGVAIAAAGGWFLSRRALAPVDAIVAAARRIQAEDLSRRVQSTGSDDEIGRLSEVLNEMLARLERSFATVSQFSADAAHELRTPLTILKGEIEVALRSSPGEGEYRRVLSSCLEEVDRLGALVEDLLFMARSDSGSVDITHMPVNLADVVNDVTPALQALADPAGVTLAVAADVPVWTRGSSAMLFRLLFNLGDNAIKYTPRRGRVEVVLEARDGKAVLEVRDSGTGIPPEERPHVFDRFYRGDRVRGRGGVGLGLALARSIAVLHGGEINVDGNPGGGSCFRVILPVTAASSQ